MRRRTVVISIAFGGLATGLVAWAAPPPEVPPEAITIEPPPPVDELPVAAPAGDRPTRDQLRQAVAPYGTWVVTTSFGSVWVPATVPVGWRPYTSGRWEWTDRGWAFAGNEPWAWVTFHYGRWVHEPPHGWVWIPGDEWAPAWVTWRYGADFVAWAPLGPAHVGVDYYAAPWLWVAVRAPFFHVPLAHGHFIPRAHLGRLPHHALRGRPPPRALPLAARSLRAAHRRPSIPPRAGTEGHALAAPAGGAEAAAAATAGGGARSAGAAAMTIGSGATRA